jgi:hypothetical protein
MTTLHSVRELGLVSAASDAMGMGMGRGMQMSGRML